MSAPPHMRRHRSGALVAALLTELGGVAAHVARFGVTAAVVRKARRTGGVKRIVEGPIPLGQRRARASEPTGARPEARSGPARRSGALAADLGRARVGLAERTAGP